MSCTRAFLPGVVARNSGCIVNVTSVASFIVDGIKREKRRVVAPAMLRILLALNYLFPYVTRSLIARTGYRRPPAV